MALVLGAVSGANSQAIAVTGTVLDSATSSPIPGASVFLVEYPELRSITAANGTFSLSGTVTGIGIPIPRPNQGFIKPPGNGLDTEDPATAEEVQAHAFDAKGAWLYPADSRPFGSCRIAFRTRLSFVSRQSRYSGLAKSAASVTLRVADPAYITRNIPLAGTTIDAGTIRLAKSDEETGVWTKVTPSTADLGTFGLGFALTDPARPNYVYCAGGNGLYRSSDYGKTFFRINRSAGSYSFAIANSNPSAEPTLWAPTGLNNGTVLKSTDGGMNWRTTGGGLATDLYSIQVDPYDNTHLISGLHEKPGIVESTDGGETWRTVGVSAGMDVGLSWYPFFINTGNAATTRIRWLAVPQQGSAGTWLTANGGEGWTQVLPNDHPHGDCQIHQADGIVYLAVESIYGPSYSPGGVYRSSDSGRNWKNVTGATDEAVVWGTPKRLYTMYGWAAGSLGDFSPNFRVASQPGTGTWATVATPVGMTQGPSSMAVTYDGTHYVFVGSMWLAGLWRYVEP